MWDQVWEDFQDLYGDEARYPFIDSVNGTVNTEEKKLRLFLLLDEEICIVFIRFISSLLLLADLCIIKEISSFS